MLQEEDYKNEAAFLHSNLEVKPPLLHYLHFLVFEREFQRKRDSSTGNLKVTDLTADFIAITKDGKGAHTHQISNFNPIVPVRSTTNTAESTKIDSSLRQRGSKFIKIGSGEKKMLTFNPEKIEQIEVEFNDKKV